MTYGGPEFIKMIQKNHKYIFLLVLAGGQDKPAWTACPPGVKIIRVGGKISRDSLPPGGQAVQGGKINCYTGTSQLRELVIRLCFHSIISLSSNGFK